MASRDHISPIPPSPKRLSSLDKNNERAGKRRSTRACLSCRNRKVRCDVVRGGVPCNNCRLDSVSCIIEVSNRGRKAANERAPSHHPGRTHSPQNQHIQLQSTPSSVGRQAISLSSPIGENQQVVCGSGKDHENSQAGGNGNVGYNICSRSQPSNDSDAGNTPRYHGELHLEDGRAASRSLESQTQYLPPYIRRLPRHIGPKDLAYLAEKDALTIPNDEFRNKLLNLYVSIVYPFTPAIELDKFLGPILRNDGNEQVSLLLFQAIMYVTVTFVDDGYLRARGYANRKSARKILFNRVRLLYGLDCETDRLTVLQALLLMTYWYDSSIDEKDARYWMGVTISLAQVLGMHRNPKNLKVTLQEKRLRHRIWWSCLIRERLISLGIRRPPRLRDDDYDVPMLTIDDFSDSLEAPSDDLVKLLGETAFTTQDIEGRKRAALICIELASLCICIGHTLDFQYSVLRNSMADSEPLTQAEHSLEYLEKQAVGFDKCETELNDWLHAQLPACRYTPLTRGRMTGNNWSSPITRLHQALLHMIYLNAVGALHRPRAFSPTTDPLDVAKRKTSIQKIKQAAVATTKLAFELQSENQLHYLSPSSIPAFLSAAVIHLLDVCSLDEEVRNISIGRFYQSVQALHQLQEMYAVAELAIQFLQKVIKSIDVEVPILAAVRLHLSNGRQSMEESENLSALWGYHSTDRALQGFSTPVSLNSQNIGPLSPSTSNPKQLATLQPGVLSMDQAMDDFAHEEGEPNFSLNCADGFNMMPQIFAWDEIDGPLPELINFDIDPGIF